MYKNKSIKHIKQQKTLHFPILQAILSSSYIPYVGGVFQKVYVPSNNIGYTSR